MRASFVPAEVKRHRRNVALASAALLVPFFAVDAFAATDIFLAVALARGAWIAALLAGAWMLRERSRVDQRIPEAMLALSSAGALTAIVALTGGAASGYFGFLFAMPFCVALLLPGALWCAAIAGVTSLTSGAVFLTSAHAPGLEIARWMASAVGGAVIASAATRTMHDLLRRHFDTEQTRAALAEQLADNVRRLATAERLALAGRLAAGVAHEVNNPLVFVKSNLQWARGRLRDDAIARNDVETDEALAEAELGVQRIARIVADLGTFCRPQPSVPCSAELPAVIDEARRIAAYRTGTAIAVRASLAPDLPEVRICRGLLVQVLVNLVVNAADALEERGPGEPGWIEIAAAPVPDGVAITVQDSGPGIPADILPLIFDPFFTTKAPGRGTGLGLALAREFLAGAGGAISAANGPGGGARFELVLPAAAAPGGARARCPSCEYLPQAPIRIALPALRRVV